MHHEARYIWFDFIRGLSALAVFASHLRNMLLVDYAEITHPSPLLRAIYLASGLGHQAVMVFFVLSGFFVGGAILTKKDRFSWKHYSLARLSRLYTVLIPALLLTLALDTIVAQQAPAALAGAYSETWNSGPDASRPWSIAPLTALGNLLFLQTIFTPVFGSNSPLWSLANEFWYYVLFPLIAISVGIVRRGRGARCLSTALAALIICLLPSKILIYGIIWLMGVALVLVPETKIARSLPARLVTTVVFLACLVASKTSILPPALSDFCVALTFTLLAYCLKNNHGTIASLIVSPARWLSEISYTLYVVHFPCMLALGALLYKGQQLQPTLSGLGHFLCWLIVLFAISALLWWCFERNTPKVRKLMAKMVRC